MEAAQAFLKEAIAVAQKLPERVTTDGHNAYPRAIAEVLGVVLQKLFKDRAFLSISSRYAATPKI